LSGGAKVKHEDKQIFEQEMTGVRPLKTEAAKPTHRQRERPEPGTLYRRAAAQRPIEADENFLTSGLVEFVHPLDVLSFKRGGIQNGVFHTLQRGGYRIDATLDLHLMTIEEARVEVYGFIRSCVRYEVRTALINHGKGNRSKDSRAMIKSYLARWLPQFKEIMAFHSAQGFHGGTGAVYVMLRKSEKAKDRVRERLGLSSGKPEPQKD